MATQKFEVDESYSLLGVAPAAIEPKTLKGIRVHIGMVKPDDDTEDYHDVTTLTAVEGTENIYVRAEYKTAFGVITEVQ